MSQPKVEEGHIEEDTRHGLVYIQYGQDKEAEYLTAIRQLISKDLSEPYSIYVYRYFLYQWGDLCFMVSTLDLKLASQADVHPGNRYKWSAHWCHRLQVGGTSRRTTKRLHSHDSR